MLFEPFLLLRLEFLFLLLSNYSFFMYILIPYYIIVSTTSIFNTSGAHETLLVKFISLNSRAIAPKTRVPFGFPS